jgi:hypothetical protein
MREPSVAASAASLPRGAPAASAARSSAPQGEARRRASVALRALSTFQEPASAFDGATPSCASGSARGGARRAAARESARIARRGA